ncbi:MAG: hypothetical protein EAZ42_04820 [Verrucomicrobia bacterium]|nr:MAG: hypothetical protein EAZ42_04820 [Verrucomicrobiota bacterium]
MISLIGNRPALQIGHHQVIEYDVAWLDVPLQRAASDAGLEDFPFVSDIRQGIAEYLEKRCSLQMLPLASLYERIRKMLIQIGYEAIAQHLRQIPPPITISLVRPAMEAGNGFELAFFTNLRAELEALKAAGAEELRFIGINESAQILRGSNKWNSQCEKLAGEIELFISAWGQEVLAVACP